jgi:hypothetical protein
MTDRVELYRRLLGLADDATPNEVAEKYMERMNQLRAGNTAPAVQSQTERWSMPIDPSAIQPSSIALSEAQAELTGLFKQMTEPSADGMSFAELETMEQTIAKYPQLYDAYRKLVTQSG